MKQDNKSVNKTHSLIVETFRKGQLVGVSRLERGRRFLIGSKPGSRIFLPLGGVARQHAYIILQRDGSIFLENVDPSLETHFHDKKIESRVQLSDGDSFSVGGYKLRLRVHEQKVETLPENSLFWSSACVSEEIMDVSVIRKRGLSDLFQLKEGESLRVGDAPGGISLAGEHPGKDFVVRDKTGARCYLAGGCTGEIYNSKNELVEVVEPECEFFFIRHDQKARILGPSIEAQIYWRNREDLLLSGRGRDADSGHLWETTGVSVIMSTLVALMIYFFQGKEEFEIVLKEEESFRVINRVPIPEEEFKKDILKKVERKKEPVLAKTSPKKRVLAKAKVSGFGDSGKASTKNLRGRKGVVASDKRKALITSKGKVSKAAGRGHRDAELTASKRKAPTTQRNKKAQALSSTLDRFLQEVDNSPTDVGKRKSGRSLVSIKKKVSGARSLGKTKNVRSALSSINDKGKTAISVLQASTQKTVKSDFSPSKWKRKEKGREISRIKKVLEDGLGDSSITKPVAKKEIPRDDVERKKPSATKVSAVTPVSSEAIALQKSLTQLLETTDDPGPVPKKVAANRSVRSALNKANLKGSSIGATLGKARSKALIDVNKAIGSDANNPQKIRGSGAELLAPGTGSDSRFGKVSKYGKSVEEFSKGLTAMGDGLERGAIARVVRAYLGRIKHCYERQLILDPKLSGKITASWTIAPSGRVSSARQVQDTMGNVGVTKCVINQIRVWKFPKPKGGGKVIVTYPFLFRSLG